MILAFVLGFVLVAGQPHAVVAGWETSDVVTGASIAPSDYKSEKDYSVEITSVGPDALSTYTPVSDGLYHVESDQAFNLVRVNVTIAGFNGYERTFGNSTHNVTLDNVAHAGEFYQIVNGQVSRAAASVVSGTAGVDVALTASYNTISFLYVGRDQDGTVTWASDTVNVRIASADFGFPDVTVLDVPFTNSITDDAADNTQVNIEDILYYNAFSGLARNQVFEPAQDITVTWTGSEGSDSVSDSGNVLDIAAASDDLGSFAFTGTVDTTGFHGGAHFTNWNWSTFDYNGETLVNSSAGVTLIQDVNGLSVLGASGTVAVLVSSELSQTFSPFSFVSLADYGTWDWALDVFGAGIDWDAQFSVSTLDANVASNITDADIVAMEFGWSGGFYGSNDFSSEGYSVGVENDLEETRAPQTNVETVTEEGSVPGFGILASLLAVGAIAYVAPRMRKD